jgi:hypothetical protein
MFSRVKLDAFLLNEVHHIKIKKQVLMSGITNTYIQTTNKMTITGSALEIARRWE